MCTGKYGEPELNCVLYQFPTQEQKEAAIKIVESDVIASDAEAEILSTTKFRKVGTRNSIDMDHVKDIKTIFIRGKQNITYHFDKPAWCTVFKFGWVKSLHCTTDNRFGNYDPIHDVEELELILE